MRQKACDYIAYVCDMVRFLKNKRGRDSFREYYDGVLERVKKGLSPTWKSEGSYVESTLMKHGSGNHKLVYKVKCFPVDNKIHYYKVSVLPVFGGIVVKINPLTSPISYDDHNVKQLLTDLFLEAMNREIETDDFMK